MIGARHTIYIIRRNRSGVIFVTKHRKTSICSKTTIQLRVRMGTPCFPLMSAEILGNRTGYRGRRCCRGRALRFGVWLYGISWHITAAYCQCIVPVAGGQELGYKRLYVPDLRHHHLNRYNKPCLPQTEDNVSGVAQLLYPRLCVR